MSSLICFKGEKKLIYAVCFAGLDFNSGPKWSRLPHLFWRALLHLFRYCKHPWCWQVNGQKAPSVSICVFGTDNKSAFRVKIWIMGFVLVHMAAHYRTQCDFHVDAAFCPAYIHLVHLFVSFVAMSTSTTSIQRSVRSPWLLLGIKKKILIKD